MIPLPSATCAWLSFSPEATSQDTFLSRSHQQTPLAGEKGARRRPVTQRHLQVIDAGLVGRGAERAEDAQGTPTQSHVSPSILDRDARRRPHDPVTQRHLREKPILIDNRT